MNDLLKQYQKSKGSKPILIGHSVLGDFDSLGLEDVKYIDTTNFRHKSGQYGQIRKLKDLVSEYLNASI